MQKCWPMWFQITHLPQRGNCFRKLTNITFAYLLSPTIILHFKQMFIQGCILLAQIGSKLLISPKRYFLVKLTITFVSLLCSILHQHYNNLREQIIRQSFVILAQIGLDSVHQKGTYWKSWPTLHWSFISHHATYFQINPDSVDHTVA